MEIFELEPMDVDLEQRNKDLTLNLTYFWKEFEKVQDIEAESRSK